VDDALEFLEVVVIDHVERNSLVDRVQPEFVEGDNVLVFDNEIGQEIAFYGDIFSKAHFPNSDKPKEI